MATNSKDLEVNVFLLLLISKNENQVKALSSVIKKFSDEDFYNKIIQINNKKQILNIIKNKEI